MSIAAWFGSIPLTLGYFHLMSWSALPANLLAVPISFFIMAVATLSLLFGVVWSGFAVILNQTNWLLTKAMLAAVSAFASLPGSHVYLPMPSWNRPVAELTVFDFGGGAANLLSTGNEACDSSTAGRRTTTIARWCHFFVRAASCVSTASSSRMATPRTSAPRFRCWIRQGLASSRTALWMIGHRAEIACMPRSSSSEDPSAFYEQATVGQSARTATAHVLYPPTGLTRGLADDQAIVTRPRRRWHTHSARFRHGAIHR